MFAQTSTKSRHILRLLLTFDELIGILKIQFSVTDGMGVVSAHCRNSDKTRRSTAKEQKRYPKADRLGTSICG